MDSGVGTRTGVNGDDYQVPFPFIGTITLKLSPSQFAAEDNKVVTEAIASAKN
jgi:hypothetical protein